jgi:hypothetical protein
MQLASFPDLSIEKDCWCVTQLMDTHCHFGSKYQEVFLHNTVLDILDEESFKQAILLNDK